MATRSVEQAHVLRDMFWISPLHRRRPEIQVTKTRSRSARARRNSTAPTTPSPSATAFEVYHQQTDSLPSYYVDQDLLEVRRTRHRRCVIERISRSWTRWRSKRCLTSSRARWSEAGLAVAHPRGAAAAVRWER